MSESSSSDASLTVRLKLNDKDIRDKLTDLRTDLRKTFQDTSFMGRGLGTGTPAPGAPPQPTAGQAPIQLGSKPPVIVYGEHVGISTQGRRAVDEAQHVFVNVQPPVKGDHKDIRQRPADVRTSFETGDVALGVAPVREATTVGQWLDWVCVMMGSTYGGIKFFGARGQTLARRAMAEVEMWVGKGVLSLDTIIGDISQTEWGEGYKLGYLEQEMMNVRDNLSRSSGGATRTSIREMEKGERARMRGPSKQESIIHEAEKTIAKRILDITKGLGRVATETDIGTGRADVIARNVWNHIINITEVKSGLERVGTPADARQIASYMQSPEGGIEPYIKSLLDLEDRGMITREEVEDPKSAFKTILMGRGIDLTGMAGTILSNAWRLTYFKLRGDYGDRLPSWVKADFNSVFKTFDTDILLTSSERDEIYKSARTPIEAQQLLVIAMWNRLVNNPKKLIQAIGADAFFAEYTKGKEGIIKKEMTPKEVGDLMKRFPTGIFNPFLEGNRAKANRFKRMLEMTMDITSPGKAFDIDKPKSADEWLGLTGHLKTQDPRLPSAEVKQFYSMLIGDKLIPDTGDFAIMAQQIELMIEDIVTPSVSETDLRPTADIPADLRKAEPKLTPREKREKNYLQFIAERSDHEMDFFDKIAHDSTKMDEFVQFLGKGRGVASNITMGELKVLLASWGLKFTGNKADTIEYFRLNMPREHKKKYFAEMREINYPVRGEKQIEQAKREEQEELMNAYVRGELEFRRTIDVDLPIDMGIRKGDKETDLRRKMTRFGQKHIKNRLLFYPKWDLFKRQFADYYELKWDTSYRDEETQVKITNFLMTGMIGGFIGYKEAQDFLRKTMLPGEFDKETSKLQRMVSNIESHVGMTSIDMERSIEEIEGNWLQIMAKGAPESLEKIKQMKADFGEAWGTTLWDEDTGSLVLFSILEDMNLGRKARDSNLGSIRDLDRNIIATELLKRVKSPAGYIQLQNQLEKAVKEFTSIGFLPESHPLRPLGATGEEVRANLIHVHKIVKEEIADENSELFTTAFGLMKNLSNVTPNVGIATSLNVWFPTNTGS